MPVPVVGVVGKHQRADFGSDLVYFGVGQSGIVQADQRRCLVLDGELRVEEWFQEVAPYILALADRDLVGLAELLQVLTLRCGDEQGLAGLGPDLRRRGGRVGVPDGGCGKRAVTGAAYPGEVILGEDQVIVSECDSKSYGHGSSSPAQPPLEKTCPAASQAGVTLSRRRAR